MNLKIKERGENFSFHYLEDKQFFFDTKKNVKFICYGFEKSRIEDVKKVMQNCPPEIPIERLKHFITTNENKIIAGYIYPLDYMVARNNTSRNGCLLYLKEVIPGLKYINKFGTHCDIRPDNLIMRSGTTIITNFKSFVMIPNMQLELEIICVNFGIWTHKIKNFEELGDFIDRGYDYENKIFSYKWEWGYPSIVGEFIKYKSESRFLMLLIPFYCISNLAITSLKKSTKEIFTNNFIIEKFNSENPPRFFMPEIIFESIMPLFNKMERNGISFYLYPNLSRVDYCEKLSDIRIEGIEKAFEKISKYGSLKYPHVCIYKEHEKCLVRVGEMEEGSEKNKKFIQLLKKLKRLPYPNM